MIGPRAYHNVEALCDWSKSSNAFWGENCERSPGFPALVLSLVVECCTFTQKLYEKHIFSLFRSFKPTVPPPPVHKSPSTANESIPVAREKIRDFWVFDATKDMKSRIVEVPADVLPFWGWHYHNSQSRCMQS